MDKDEKIVKFILAALFQAASAAGGKRDAPAQSFDQAEAFVAEAKARDCFPEFPPES